MTSCEEIVFADAQQKEEERDPTLLGAGPCVVVARGEGKGKEEERNVK